MPKPVIDRTLAAPDGRHWNIYIDTMNWVMVQDVENASRFATGAIGQRPDPLDDDALWDVARGVWQRWRDWQRKN